MKYRICPRCMSKDLESPAKSTKTACMDCLFINETIHFPLINRALKVHELKSWPIYFKPVWSGEKRFEIRINDRDFKTGQYLMLKEYVPEWQETSLARPYTGREIMAVIKYVMPGDEFVGVLKSFAIMTIETIIVDSNSSISQLWSNGA